MKRSVWRIGAAALMLLACVTQVGIVAHAAGSKVPPAIGNLLPKTAALKGQDWGVFKTEFGKTFSGGMHAQFPQLPNTCDITVGPELRVTIKGDTAWESPPMLDMAIQNQADEMTNARKSLPGFVKTMLKTNNSVVSIGKLQEETVPSGRLLYVEFSEGCARHSGAATVLRGFARKGATMMSIELVLTRPAAEARAMILDMFSSFQKLDTAALTR